MRARPPSLVRSSSPSVLMSSRPTATRRGVDPDVVLFGDIDRRTGELLAVDRDSPGGDPGFRVAARAQARPRHGLGDAFAGMALGGRRLSLTARCAGAVWRLVAHRDVLRQNGRLAMAPVLSLRRKACGSSQTRSPGACSNEVRKAFGGAKRALDAVAARCG